MLVDTNACPAALLAASRHAGRLWVEPVSVAKAARAAPLLAHAAFVSPNAAELVSLAHAVRAGHGRGGPPLPASSADGYADAAQALAALRGCIEEVLAAGCAHCVTTLGAAGCLLSWRSSGATRHLHIPAQRVSSVVSTAGAGDALVAGALAALCRGKGAAEAVAAGAAAAAVVVQRPENVPPEGAWPSRLELAASAAPLLAAARELS